MVVWLSAAVAVLSVTAIVLGVKVYVMRKSAREIREGFSARISAGTNTLIDLTAADGEMRRLTVALNRELAQLRSRQLQFMNGDRELKESVANIAHDLRTPLTAICGYLELIAQEDKSPQAEKYLAVVGERAENMKRLTEQLFRYSVLASEPEDECREQVSLNAALENALIAHYATLKERGIEPVVSLPEEKVTRCLNKQSLARVFSNVVGNAAKYSDGDLFVTLNADGRIVFENSAAGLDEVTTGRLFHRFFTVESARGGSTGLGLSIAKLLTERMGGEISAQLQGGRLRIVIQF